MTTTQSEAQATDCEGCGAEAEGGFHFDDCLLDLVEPGPLTLQQVVLARRLVVAVEDHNRANHRSQVQVRAMHRALDAETERIASAS